jgi:hypothetical protein
LPQQVLPASPQFVSASDKFNAAIINMIALSNQSFPVIVDTDGGVDDALALIMALNSPELDLKAVTVVAGNINVEQAANNV